MEKQADKITEHFRAYKKTFTERFQQQIRLTLGTAIRQVNAELIMLFWQTGKALDTALQASHEKSLIKKIAPELIRRFGDYFNENNLQQMRQFFLAYPDTIAVDQIKYKLSWEHILLLLAIEDNKTRSFYLQYHLEHPLKAAELKKQIAAGLHRQKTDPDKVQHKKDEKQQQNGKARIETTISSLYALSNPFRLPLLPALKTLTELAARKTAIIEPKNNDISSLLLHKINGLVYEYRVTANRSLNSYTNIAFFELGREINTENELAVDTPPDVGILISRTSRELRKNFGVQITQIQLKQMAEFAALCKQHTLVSVVAGVLTWKQILVLLPFHSIQLINHYVNKTGQTNIGLPAFRNLVNKEAEQILMNLNGSQIPDNPFPLLVNVITTSGKSKKGFTKITYIDERNGVKKERVNPRIFQDRKILRLLSII